MISKLVFRAMVLGAVACAFSATGFTADVQNARYCRFYYRSKWG